MQSPLPDSSALEAGIVEDRTLPCSSSIQDKVRSLLRASLHNVSNARVNEEETIYVSFDDGQRLVQHDCPTAAERRSEARQQILPDIQTRPMPAPEEPLPLHPPAPVLPSPRSPNFDNMTVVEDSLPTRCSRLGFNHPDLEAQNDETLALLVRQQARHHRHHDRQKNDRVQHHGSNHRRSTKPAIGIRVRAALCVGSGLLLAALLTTYLCLVLAPDANVPTLFHILFILSLMVTTILFSHSIVRLCMACTHPSAKSKRHIRVDPLADHHPRHRRPRYRDIPDLPALSGCAADGEPARPTATPGAADEAVEATADGTPAHNVPPPAYGRWRGSVRVDPTLVDWRTLPASPADTVAIDEEPPLYASPLRVRGGRACDRHVEVVGARGGRVEEMDEEEVEDARAAGQRAEMVEVHGISISF
ncbi:hypothetical protein MBLNU459_g6671t1 [Dothideomycetes sp. NU459]